MYTRTTDLNHTKKGTAALIACLVQTLNESDPAFQDRFLERLASSYNHLRDSELASIHELELLAHTREVLTGIGFGHGQGEFAPGVAPKGAA
jgi:hypothetical protein